MPSDDHDDNTRGNNPKELCMKMKLWVDTPDGKRVWLKEWLDSLPPGSKVRIVDSSKQSNVIPFPSSDQRR